MINNYAKEAQCSSSVYNEEYSFMLCHKDSWSDPSIALIILFLDNLMVFCCSSLSDYAIVDQIGKILTMCVHGPKVKFVGFIVNQAVVVACFVAGTTSGGISSRAFQGNVNGLTKSTVYVKSLLVSISFSLSWITTSSSLLRPSVIRTFKPSTNICSSSRSFRTSLVGGRLTLSALGNSWEKFLNETVPFSKTFRQSFVYMNRYFRQRKLSCWAWRIWKDCHRVLLETSFPTKIRQGGLNYKSSAIELVAISSGIRIRIQMSH